MSVVILIILIDVCTASSVSGDFPALARVLSVGAGTGFNKLCRNGPVLARVLSVGAGTGFNPYPANVENMVSS